MLPYLLLGHYRMANKTNEEANRRIGQLLQEARESREVLQSEMSGSCGLSKNHISAVERGVSKASIDMLLSYCDRLKMTPNEILGIDKDNILPELKTLQADMNKEQQQKVFQILKLMSDI